MNSTQIQRIISSSASDFNKVAEKIILEKFLKEGFKELPAKFGSNNGIDILLVDSKYFSKLTKMIIIEVKSYTSKTVPTTTTLDIGYDFRQMTDGWIEAVRTKLIGQTDELKKEAGELLDKVLKGPPGKLEKYVIQIDKQGNAAMIRVN